MNVPSSAIDHQKSSHNVTPVFKDSKTIQPDKIHPTSVVTEKPKKVVVVAKASIVNIPVKNDKVADKNDDLKTNAATKDKTAKDCKKENIQISS